MINTGIGQREQTEFRSIWKLFSDELFFPVIGTIKNQYNGFIFRQQAQARD